MCGIVAYAGKEPCRDILIEGIKRLEYRGYDSWGFYTFENGEIQDFGRFIGAPSEMSSSGLIQNYGKSWSRLSINPTATIGLCHTRWATHGKVSIKNTHPVSGGKLGDDKLTYVVHNGIIENYKEKQDFLRKQGYDFITETDTEVLANLINFYLAGKNTIIESIKEAVNDLKGDYCFVSYHQLFPKWIFGYSRNSPLVITENGMVASDPIAFSGFADKYTTVPKNHIFIIKNGYNGVEILFHNMGGGFTVNPVFKYDAPKISNSENSDIPLMLQEIHSQAVPQTVPHSIKIPVKQKVYYHGLHKEKTHDFLFGDNVCLFGCGSSYNAALVGRNYLEAADVPTRVEYATELPFRKNDFQNTWYIALTQSGETKDTLDAIQYLKANGGTISVITNNGYSQAAGLATPILLGVGPEQAVAATKTFTEQCMKLLEIGLSTLCKHSEVEIESINEPIARLLLKEKEIERLAKYVNDWENYLFLARGQLFPIALEGALKVKEVSYKHAEAVHASEMKHGPIALIDDNTLSLFLLTSCENEKNFDRVCSNIEEIKARGGCIVAITDEASQKRIESLIDGPVLSVPTLRDYRSPLVVNVALQLLAYYLAVINGHNVDRPRSLCKSVTV